MADIPHEVIGALQHLVRVVEVTSADLTLVNPCLNVPQILQHRAGDTVHG